MKVHSYSPSVEVYAMLGESREAVDLSGDVVACTVSRKSDAASEFSVTLQNKNWKYNGRFTPFDPIVVYATKSERVKLFSGFITTMDAFQLYQGDFKISGFCTLYRLQQFYWDPGLYKSQRMLFADAYNNGQVDNGYAMVVRNLLVNVAYWPDDSIYIGDLPNDAVQMAYEFYEAGKDSSQQLKDRINEFYDILKSRGPKFSVSSGGTSVAGESGGLSLSGDEAKASADQKAIVAKAVSGTVGGESGMCLKWVGDVYEAAGFPFARYWGAVEVWRHRTEHKAYDTDMSKIPIAACVVGSGSGSGGAGHIGIYIGNGQVISEVGGQRVESVETFGSWQDDVIDGQSGNYGWVCPDCGAQWN